MRIRGSDLLQALSQNKRLKDLPGGFPVLSASDADDLRENGALALSLAACYKSPQEGFEVVKFLVSLGANPNVPDSRGWFPIHHAAGSLDIAAYLVTCGNADPNPNNKYHVRDLSLAFPSLPFPVQYCLFITPCSCTVASGWLHGLGRGSWVCQALPSGTLGLAANCLLPRQLSMFSPFLCLHLSAMDPAVDAGHHQHMEVRQSSSSLCPPRPVLHAPSPQFPRTRPSVRPPRHRPPCRTRCG